MVTLKIFNNKELDILNTQFLHANARDDFETANKLAKILSEHNHKDPEFRKLLNQLGIE